VIANARTSLVTPRPFVSRLDQIDGISRLGSLRD
jgi:hypothetical protein